ncbi:Cellulose biosynthesis protein BcsQ [Filimonas lacunae]|uniref:Cellulose biosynthesis protein BcsQ n=1 Tax=Filimonas lacunae TaxID=477680 RepID=A0A173MQW2_9BACT|nr:AAA family ATPase [Filimonas lacunae]BAV09771.1 chromosome (plasmid) partitioning protein ParA [Filimonas lacunae]SIS78760.1 Cellulose biosynthesis protein BcsQ [Filimonas lacunae]
MISLALYNLKGGVGKTASTVNLAYLAAADGWKTLVWDLDPQGSSSYYFNVESDVKNVSRKLLTDEISIADAAHETAYENLWVIPADLSARNADVVLDEMKQSKKKIKNLLSNVKGFDIVFLDCPPGISLLHDNVFHAADWVLMPNIPTTLSIRSYETVVDYFTEHDLDTAKIKCFFSMVDHRKNLHHEIVQTFYKDKIFFKNYIPYLSDVEKMGVNQLPLFDFANSSYAAQCYRDLWQEIKKTIR